MGQRMLASAEWLLLAVALVWGTSYGVAKLALEHYPVYGVLAVRFILAGLCLLPALRAIRWQAWRAGLPMGGILLAILLCETWALQYTSASNAAFLISLCLVLTPLAEWLLYGQRPAARIWALVGLSWLGALLLTGDSAMHFSGGDALMLLAAVLRAFGVCWLKQLADRQPATAQALTAMQCWTVGLGALALSASQGGLPPLPRDPGFWLAISYLAVLCTVCAFAIQNYALRRSDPSRVALLMGSEPVFGALFAWLWLGEAMGPLRWLGGGLMAVAAVMATGGGSKVEKGVGEKKEVGVVG